MDNRKVGELIYHLRKEKQLTQKQLADQMNISDRTISKWERGCGCPDVTLLQSIRKGPILLAFVRFHKCCLKGQ